MVTPLKKGSETFDIASILFRVSTVTDNSFDSCKMDWKFHESNIIIEPMFLELNRSQAIKILEGCLLGFKKYKYSFSV